MSMSENIGFVPVDASHRQYIADVLTGDEFSEKMRCNLDISVKNVLTTIPNSRCEKVDFHYGNMFPRQERVLLDWVQNFLAVYENSCVLLFNVCAERYDKCASQYVNVFYYHDQILKADKIVHVIHKDASLTQIAQSLREAETSIALIGAAISAMNVSASDLRGEISKDLLFELLDSSLYLISGICDGEAWCFWPTYKLSAAHQLHENLTHLVE